MHTTQTAREAAASCRRAINTWRGALFSEPEIVEPKGSLDAKVMLSVMVEDVLRQLTIDFAELLPNRAHITLQAFDQCAERPGPAMAKWWSSQSTITYNSTNGQLSTYVVLSDGMRSPIFDLIAACKELHQRFANAQDAFCASIQLA